MANDKITQKQVDKMQKASRREWFIENNIPVHKEKVFKDKRAYDRKKNKKIDID